MSQRPANASAAAAPVRAIPQYKYAAGVRNPQQHVPSQPQVPMQQVRNTWNAKLSESAWFRPFFSRTT